MTTTERLPDISDDFEITLGILNAVHENERVTQRSVSKELGIALGLTNAYLKRCVKKGLIKVSQAPANRYAYYLTPTGFAEKSRLTAEYLSYSFRFFRSARNQCADAVEQAGERGWYKVALYGMGELAEIASLCEAPKVEIVAIVDPECTDRDFGQLPVARGFEEIPPVDAVILTALADPQSAFEGLCVRFPSERIFTPPLLRVIRNGNAATQSGDEAP